MQKFPLGCQDDLLAEQAVHSQITSAVLVIFFISLLGVGVGQTAVSTLGIPYIDDNVASRESPIYIGNFETKHFFESHFDHLINCYSHNHWRSNTGTSVSFYLWYESVL